MRQYISAVTMAIVLTFASTAVARIGETLEQCQVRYGKGIPADGRFLFRKAGFYIIIEFYDGKADMIAFRKVEKNILGISAPISDNEIQNLLKQNGGGQTWKKAEEVMFDSGWRTEDEKLLAAYSMMEHFVGIFTLDHSLRETAKKKAKEDKKLEGF